MTEIPVPSTWRDPQAYGGPIVITVNGVDEGANTVTGHSHPENAPTTTAVWVGAPGDFVRMTRLA